MNGLAMSNSLNGQTHVRVQSRAREEHGLRGEDGGSSREQRIDKPRPPEKEIPSQWQHDTELPQHIQRVHFRLGAVAL